jgi:hypothetical protein
MGELHVDWLEVNWIEVRHIVNGKYREVLL